MMERGGAGILGIDPDLRTSGYAIFSGEGTFIDAGVLHGNKKGARDHTAWFEQYDETFSLGVPIQIAYEMPVVYSKDKSRKDKAADPNDLMQLVAALSSVLCGFNDKNEVVYCKAYRPAQWKGQVPKDIHQEHHIIPTIKKLGFYHQFTECAKGLKDPEIVDMVDAVGIAMKHLCLM